MKPRTRTRFAPSPTGYLHIGGLRTALYALLQARHDGGDFVLRIEDTDRTRFVEGSMEKLCSSLKSCGLIPDEGVWTNDAGEIIQRGDVGPYIQSQAKERHLKYADELINMGKAYYCFCTPERLENLRDEQQKSGKPTMYDGACRELPAGEVQERLKDGESYVIRLKLPKSGTISFQDAIRGEITFDWSLVDDQVLIKSDGFPTYHLASTADDHDMSITHVLRGEEWISSTPKHLFLIEAMGWEMPVYAHLPLLLNPDRSKLSKRQGDVAVEDYLNNGYLPEALVNFVGLLGWNPSADQEIYTLDEMAKAFVLENVNKAGAVFNLEKLDWMNREYLKRLSEDQYLALTRPHVMALTDDVELGDRVALIVRERLSRPSDVTEYAKPFLAREMDYSKVSLTWKTQTVENALERLEGLAEACASCPESAFDDVAHIETAIKKIIEEHGWSNGEVLWPLRVALSGQEKSPTPFDLAYALGKKRSLARVQEAIQYLKTRQTTSS